MSHPGLTPALGTTGQAAASNTHYKVSGDGPWLVLIHGVGLDLDIWTKQVAILETQRQVLSYDLIGHGHTPPVDGDLTLGDFVEQLELLLEALNVSRADLVGFSMGAMVAQAFTLAHPARVNKLVLLNGVYARPDSASASVLARLRLVESDGIASTIEAAIDRWFSEAYRDQHPQEIESIERRLRANNLEGFLPAYRVFATADAALAGRLGDITAPTLIVTGENDVGSTPEMARQMSEQIPHAALRILPGVRHMLPLEGAEPLNALLENFLFSGEKKP